MNTYYIDWASHLGFLGGSTGKESARNAGDQGSIPGLGSSHGKGKGYPLPCSGLENSMNYTVHTVAKSQTGLSNFHFLDIILLLLLSRFSHVRLCATP